VFLKEGVRVDPHMIGFIVFAHGEFEIVRVVGCTRFLWYVSVETPEGVVLKMPAAVDFEPPESGDIVVNAYAGSQLVERWRKPIGDVGANRGNYLQGIR